MAANDRIQVASIGFGIMGHGDAQTASSVAGVKMVAVSDVYDGRMTRFREMFGKDCFCSRDYREILARKDVDAVIIATPDHWHDRIAIDAMNAGKDLYVQKPMVQKVEYGHPVIDTWKKTGRILQVGSQRVSSLMYIKARDLVRAGAIGEVNVVDAHIDRNSALGAWQYPIPPDASPRTIDWDRFLGRAPKKDFDPIRLFRWRNYQDYGTGIPGDLFVHQFTAIHFVMDSIGPTRISASGGLHFWKDGRDVPDVMLGMFDYPKTDAHPEFHVVLRVNFVAGQNSQQFRFVGTEGILTFGGDGLILSKRPRETEPGYQVESFSKAMQDAYIGKYREKYPLQTPNADAMRPMTDEKFPLDGRDAQRAHHVNFIEAVRSRKPVVEDAIFGLRAAAPAVLANTSYFERRPVNWDPVAMKQI